MAINKFILFWDQKTVDKLKEKHNLNSEEVEEVIYDDKAYITKGEILQIGKSYIVLGQTHAGRYIKIVLVQYDHNSFGTITARDMEDDERKLYKRKI
jgi:hypothetical protein